MRTRPEDMLNSERGFTLLELMVCLFIIGLLFSSVYIILSVANQLFRSTDLYSRLNQSAMQTFRYINREVGQTSPNASPSHLNISTDLNSNSVIRFQIPVDWDNDGDADSGGSNPAIEWGAYTEAGQKLNGNLNAWARYSVSNGQLVRTVLDSSYNPIDGMSRVVADNVLSFTVTQNSNVLTMTITLRVADTIGTKGASTRYFSQSFSSTTILRNAVN